MHQRTTNPIREMLHGNGPQRDTVMYVSSVSVRVEKGARDGGVAHASVPMSARVFIRVRRAGRDLEQVLHWNGGVCVWFRVHACAPSIRKVPLQMLQQAPATVTGAEEHRC